MSNKILVLSKRIVYLGIIFSTILLSLQGFEDLIGRWYICVIPVAISFLYIPILTYYMISVKCAKIDSFSFNLFQFCSVNMSTFLCLFLILASLRLDGEISSSWCSIFICIWYTLIYYFVLCIFMFPGLNSVNMKREAWGLIEWGIGITTTSILLPIWIDKSIEKEWVVVLPLFIVCSSNILWYFYSVLMQNLNLGKEIIIYLMIYAIVLVIWLDEKPWVFPVLAGFFTADFIISEYSNHTDYEKL